MRSFILTYHRIKDITDLTILRIFLSNWWDFQNTSRFFFPESTLVCTKCPGNHDNGMNIIINCYSFVVIISKKLWTIFICKFEQEIVYLQFQLYKYLRYHFCYIECNTNYTADLTQVNRMIPTQHCCVNGKSKNAIFESNQGSKIEKFSRILLNNRQNI